MRCNARGVSHNALALGIQNARINNMKRYCQTLTLVDEVEMIRQYVEVHAHVWPEVIAG